jgi:hypothetical protein
MNQLCLKFSVVAAHNTAAFFAVACPETTIADADLAVNAAQSPVSIYHLNTGTKTHILMVDSGRGQRGGADADINPLAPLSLVRLRPSMLCLDTNSAFFCCVACVRAKAKRYQ